MMSLSEFNNASAIFLGIYFGLPAFLLLVYLLRRIVVVEQGTAVIVERWGKFHRRLDAGLHILWPFVDSPRSFTWRSADVFLNPRFGESVKITQTNSTVIDIRENIMDFPSQPVITRDNVKLDVHPMLLFRLVDPVRVVYETYDLPHAVEKLVQTTLRSIIGEMGLDDTLSSREEIERGLKSKIARICFDWGLEIKSVELLEITPNNVVQAAMHQQLSAERIRRAAIVSADGQREKVKLEAEGACQSQIAVATGEKQVNIVRAQGQAEARRLIAKAEADSVRILASALAPYGVNPTQYIVGTKYIDAIASLAANATHRTVYFPMQTDVAGALSTVSDSIAAARR